jgi:GMP synthase-like glutamine amidotransferase
MKAAILQCDWVMDGLRQHFGEYPAMIERMFHEVDPSIEFDTFDCQAGEYPGDLDAYDFFVTTGSRAGVYEDLPWIAPLIEFVRRLDREQRKLIGICFGHQIIAEALGGSATKSDKGWGIGIAENQITVEPDWLSPDSDTLNLLVSHQDQVVALTDQARVIARSDFCPNFMVQWSEHIVSVQGHPEWQPDYSRALIEKREDLYPRDQREQALTSLDRAPDNRLFTHWVLNFINAND